MNLNLIDTDEEHTQVLFELKILDDMEDWTLYQKQEEVLWADMDIETYRQYAIVK